MTSDGNTRPRTGQAAQGRRPRVSPQLNNTVTDRLGRLLLVTLEAARLQAEVHPLPSLRTWLDSWASIGHIAVGMHRQGYDLQLTQYDDRGWRATFYTTGVEHSPTGAAGTGWEPPPWDATQGAAWETLKRAGEGG